MLQIRNVTLEGPDCSGKSTLYNNIHKASKFRWNIQDRSQLSMLCYARQFGRGDSEVERWRRELRSFLLDLNNRLIVLLPDFQVIAQRLSERGDDVQDIQSLKTLHSIFEEEVTRLGNPPNLLVFREALPVEQLRDACVKWLSMAELLQPLGAAREVLALAESMPNREAVGCRFRLTLDPTSLSVPDASILRHPPEEVYYAKILSGVLQNIDDELKGKNEYGVKQNQYYTRRFIFTQDSCISLVHTILRGDNLNMRVYCRSSNAKDVFSYDVQFICYLFSRIYARLASHSGWSYPPRGNFTVDVELGSAHVL
jgi:hypothetical protein